MVEKKKMYTKPEMDVIFMSENNVHTDIVHASSTTLSDDITSGQGSNYGAMFGDNF